MKYLIKWWQSENYSVQGIPTEYDVQIEYLQDKGGYMKKASYLQCEFDGDSFAD